MSTNKFSTAAKSNVQFQSAHSFRRGKGCETSTKVLIRVRPPEHEGKVTINVVNKNMLSIQKLDSRGEPTNDIRWFTFDNCMNPNTTKEEVFEAVESHVDDVMNGYNSTILMYGQTGSGKTYTMNGVLPDSIHQIFKQVPKPTANERLVVTACYIEIWNNAARDLWKPAPPASKTGAKTITVRTPPLAIKLQNVSQTEKVALIPGLTIYEFDTPEALLDMVRKAEGKRSVKPTAMNDASSRSHSVLLLQIRKIFKLPSAAQSKVRKVASATGAENKKGPPLPCRIYVTKPQSEIEVVSTLTLVDLAGSEDLRRSKAAGATKEEAQFINGSLSILRLCAERIATKKNLQPPFRDSVLTKILVNSVGGNCRTTIIATLSCVSENYLDSLSTLRFVNVARRVRCHVKQKTTSAEEALTRMNKLLADKRLSAAEIADLKACIDAVNGDLQRRETIESQYKERESQAALRWNALLATAEVVRQKASALSTEMTLLNDGLQTKEKQLRESQQALDALRVLEANGVPISETRRKEMIELEDTIEAVEGELEVLRHKFTSAEGDLQALITRGDKALTATDLDRVAELAKSTHLEDMLNDDDTTNLIVGDPLPDIIASPADSDDEDADTGAHDGAENNEENVTEIQAEGIEEAPAEEADELLAQELEREMEKEILSKAAQLFCDEYEHMGISLLRERERALNLLEGENGIMRESVHMTHSSEEYNQSVLSEHAAMLADIAKQITALQQQEIENNLKKASENLLQRHKEYLDRLLQESLEAEESIQQQKIQEYEALVSGHASLELEVKRSSCEKQLLAEHKEFLEELRSEVVNCTADDMIRETEQLHALALRDTQGFLEHLRSQLDEARAKKMLSSVVKLQRWFLRWPNLLSSLHIAFGRRTSTDFTVCIRVVNKEVKRIVFLTVPEGNELTRAQILTDSRRREIEPLHIEEDGMEYVVDGLKPNSPYVFYVVACGPLRGQGMRTFKLETLREIPQLTINGLREQDGSVFLDVHSTHEAVIHYIVQDLGENITAEDIQDIISNAVEHGNADGCGLLEIPMGSHELELKGISHSHLRVPKSLYVCGWDFDLMRHGDILQHQLLVFFLNGKPVVSVVEDKMVITFQTHENMRVGCVETKEWTPASTTHTISVTGYPGREVLATLFIENMPPESSVTVKALIPDIVPQLKVSLIHGRLLLETNLDGEVLYDAQNGSKLTLCSTKRNTPTSIEIPTDSLYADAKIVVFHFQGHQVVFDLEQQVPFPSSKDNIVLDAIGMSCVTFDEKRQTRIPFVVRAKDMSLWPNVSSQESPTINGLLPSTAYEFFVSYPWEDASMGSHFDIRTLQPVKLEFREADVTDDSATLSIVGGGDEYNLVRRKVKLTISNGAGEVHERFLNPSELNNVFITGLVQQTSYSAKITVIEPNNSVEYESTLFEFKTASVLPHLTDCIVVDRTATSLTIQFESSSPGYIHYLAEVGGVQRPANFQLTARTEKLTLGKNTLRLEELHPTTDYNIFMMPDNDRGSWKGKLLVMQNVLTKGNEVKLTHASVIDVGTDFVMVEFVTSGPASVSFALTTDSVPLRCARIRSGIRGFKASQFVAIGSVVAGVNPTQVQITNLNPTTQYYLHVVADALVAPELLNTDCLVIPARTVAFEAVIENVTYNVFTQCLCFTSSLDGDGQVLIGQQDPVFFPVKRGYDEVKLDIPQSDSESRTERIVLRYAGLNWSKQMVFDIVVASTCPSIQVVDWNCKDVDMSITIESTGRGVACVALVKEWTPEMDAIEYIKKNPHSVLPINEGSSNFKLSYLRPATKYTILIHPGSMMRAGIHLDEKAPTISFEFTTKTVFPQLQELEIQSGYHTSDVLEGKVKLSDDGYIHFAVYETAGVRVEDIQNAVECVTKGTIFCKGGETMNFEVADLLVANNYEFFAQYTSCCGELKSEIIRKSIVLPHPRCRIAETSIEFISTTACKLKYACTYGGKCHIAVCKAENTHVPPTPQMVKKALRSGYGTPYFFVGHETVAPPGGVFEINGLRPDESYIVYVVRDSLHLDNISYDCITIEMRTPPKAVCINCVETFPTPTSVTVHLSLTGEARVMWTVEPHGLYEYQSSEDIVASLHCRTTEADVKFVLNIENLSPSNSYDLFMVPVTKELTHVGTPQRVILRTTNIIPKLKNSTVVSLQDSIKLTFECSYEGYVTIAASEQRSDVQIANVMPHRCMKYEEVVNSAVIRVLHVDAGPCELTVSDLNPSTTYVVHIFASAFETVEPSDVSVQSYWVKTPSRMPIVQVIPQDADCTYAVLKIDSDCGGMLFYCCHLANSDVQYTPQLIRSIVLGAPYPKHGRVALGQVELLGPDHSEELRLKDLLPGMQYVLHWAVEDNTHTLETKVRYTRFRTPIPPPQIEGITLKEEGIHHVQMSWYASENGVLNVMVVPSGVPVYDSVLNFNLVQNAATLKVNSVPEALMYRVPFQAGSVSASLELLRSSTDYHVYLCVCRTNGNGIGPTIGPLDVVTGPIPPSSRAMFAPPHKAIPESETSRIHDDDTLVAVNCVNERSSVSYVAVVSLKYNAFALVLNSVVQVLGLENALQYHGSLVCPTSSVVVTLNSSTKKVILVSVPDILADMNLQFSTLFDVQRLLQALQLFRSSMMFAPNFNKEERRTARRKSLNQQTIRVSPTPTHRHTIQFLRTSSTTKIPEIQDYSTIVVVWGSNVDSAESSLSRFATKIVALSDLHVWIRNDLSKDAMFVETYAKETDRCILLRLGGTTMAFLASALTSQQPCCVPAQYYFLIGDVGKSDFEAGDMSISKSGDVVCMAVDKWTLMSASEDDSACFQIDVSLPQLSHLRSTVPSLECSLKFNFLEFLSLKPIEGKRIKIVVDVADHGEDIVQSGVARCAAGTQIVRWTAEGGLLPTTLSFLTCHVSWLKYNYASCVIVTEDDSEVLGWSWIPLLGRIDSVPVVNIENGCPSSIGTLRIAVVPQFTSGSVPAKYEEIEGVALPPEVSVCCVISSDWTFDEVANTRKRFWKSSI